jgi:hypothetical protein
MGLAVAGKTLQQQPVVRSATSPASRYIKLQQCAKIAELRRALSSAGFRSLDSQALALGLGRSSAWSVLKAGHKSTGLTASTIRQILQSEKLPITARQVLEEYIALKLAGAFGHDQKQLRRFRAALADDLRAQETKSLTPV